ncbi:MAG: crossover junction endodeoxyribonuclease RuvC [bacterium]|nr:crossover junction endodeoxyribonuclease RuvC [bacterium]
MRIIGIDPGYERLGIAAVDGPRGKEILVHSECFRTSAKLQFDERLLLIGTHLEKIIKKYQPKGERMILSIENLFITKNQKTVMRVSEVRGAIIFLAKKLGLIVVEYSPLQVKSAVIGYGRGDKRQITFMLRHLIKIPKNKMGKMLDDEYDAIALALTASACLR